MSVEAGDDVGIASRAGVWLPFPVEVSPDLDLVRDSHETWMSGNGLLGDGGDEIGTYRRFDLPQLAAFVWPYARRDDLALGCDVVGWTLAFDDWFERFAGTTDGIDGALIDDLLSVLYRAEYRGSAPTHPLVVAFSDVWTRCAAGMPESWRARAAHNWEYYLCANLHEDSDRIRNVVPSYDHYLVMRRGTVCLENYLDLCERLGGFRIPPRVFHVPHLLQLRRIAALIPALTNDVVTLPKEEAAGEVNNVILVLEQSRQLDRQKAIEVTVQMIQHHLDRFSKLAREVPTLARRYRLSTDEHDAINSYVRAQQLWMSGFEAWSRHTGRYANQVTISPPA